MLSSVKSKISTAKKLFLVAGRALFVLQLVGEGENVSNENKPQGNIDWLKTYDLALEDKVSCDGERCGNQATHYLATVCCGSVVLCCWTCIEQSFTMLLSLLSRHKMLQCRVCGSNNNPREFFTKPAKL